MTKITGVLSRRSESSFHPRPSEYRPVRDYWEGDMHVWICKCQHGVPLSEKCPECPPHLTREEISFNSETGKIERVMHFYSDGSSREVPEPTRFVWAGDDDPNWPTAP